jgi:thymidylate synthase
MNGNCNNLYFTQKNKVDFEYCSLLKEILDYGRYKESRAGGTYSLFGKSMRFDLKNGLPLLTTKRVYYKGIIHELLWFLKGDTNIKYLVENNVHIWDDDAYRYYLEISQYGNKQMSKEEFLSSVIEEKTFALNTKKDGTLKYYKCGDLGPVYGKQWRSYGKSGFDQINNIIETLRTNPNDRRMLCVAFNPDVLNEVALPPCHVMFQFYTNELTPIERLEWLCKNNSGEFDEWKLASHKKLDELNAPRYELSCSFTMRSNDFCCGNPYNIAQYAMLTYMLCEVCNMVPGELVYNGGDVHVYANHVKSAQEQIMRGGSEIIPKLKFNRKVTDINDFKYEDFIIEDYYPDPAIKYELNVGL